MWAIIGAYAVVILALMAAATAVAIFSRDHRQGMRAHAVLKTLMGATFGASSLLIIIIRLHEAGSI